MYRVEHGFNCLVENGAVRLVDDFDEPLAAVSTDEECVVDGLLLFGSKALCDARGKMFV